MKKNAKEVVDRAFESIYSAVDLAKGEDVAVDAVLVALRREVRSAHTVLLEELGRLRAEDEYVSIDVALGQMRQAVVRASRKTIEKLEDGLASSDVSPNVASLTLENIANAYEKISHP